MLTLSDSAFVVLKTVKRKKTFKTAVSTKATWAFVFLAGIAAKLFRLSVSFELWWRQPTFNILSRIYPFTRSQERGSLASLSYDRVTGSDCSLLGVETAVV